jgi:hypothetical protein
MSLSRKIEITNTMHQRFNFLTAALHAGLDNIGEILTEIYDNELFLCKHASWEEFCKETYKFGTARARQLMAAWKVTGTIGSESITNERQARAIADVPEDQREQVIEVAKAEGKVTSGSIARAAKKVVADPAEPTPAIELDCEGYPLPEDTLERWGKRNQIKELMQQVSNIKSAVKAAFEAKEWIGNNINLQSLSADLSQAYSTLKHCMPYAVCTSCSGIRSNKCTFCKGTGLLSEFSWNNIAPKEIKELRKKGMTV